MVLEGLAALGLASNILQLVDFSYKLVSGAKEITNSATGVSAQHETFETVSQSLVQLINNLDGPSSSQISAEIQTLATQTKGLAQSFIAELDKLKRKGPKRPWSGFIQAMKEANQSDKLLVLNKRLNMLQRSLNGHLLDMMRQQLVQVNEMVMEDQRLHLQTTVEVQRLRNDIMAELGNLTGQGQLGDLKVAEHLANLEDPEVLGIKETKEGKKKEGKKKAKTRKQKSKEEGREGISQEDVELPSNDASQTGDQPTKPKCIGQEDIKLLSNMFVKLSDSMRLFPTAASMAWPRYSLLKSLWYHGMQDRQQTVHWAHSETLNWIFDGSVPESYRGPRPRFVEWLEHEDGIFWIHGKPGSGKSTLMKFFANHPTTKQLLEEWASHDGKRLVFASHFFWIAGGTLQRSQKGLLRTLLFNILRDCPDLFPCVYPDHEATSFPADYEEWSIQELNKAFSKLKAQTEVRICLFIDGLDEYDPDTHEGSHQDLINTLVGISKSPSIKICTSSRSWYVFKDAFNKGKGGDISKRAVALEDLNRPDIEAYVHNSFFHNEQFKDLSNQDPRYPALLGQIVQRSQGVFLWVFLVVRSLLKGLTFADRVSDLQKRLDQIPSDLNDYFEQILNSVDDFYLKDTAAIFQIMLRSDKEVPLLALSFFFEDDDYAFKIQGLCPMTAQEISRRHDETRRRLDGRCRGLVEADTISGDSAYNCKARFIHRTMRDFLENKAMEKLFSSLPSQFDADASAAGSYLALIKTLPASGSTDSIRQINEAMYSGLFFHSRNYEFRTNKALMDVLDETRATMKLHMSAAYFDKTTFLELATRGRVWLYLQRVVETGPGISKKESEKLLHDVLFSRAHDTVEVQATRKDLVESLLRKGTSPNSILDGKLTVWEIFLGYFEKEHAEVATNSIDRFEVTRSLITHGAHSFTKDEVKIILEAEHVLPIEQLKELAELLKSRSPSHLTSTKRLSKSVRKLLSKFLKKDELIFE